MAKTAHERVHRGTFAGLRGVLLQPFTEGGIEGLVPGACHQARLLNEVFVGAESNVFHVTGVHENSAIQQGALLLKEKSPCCNWCLCFAG